MKAEAKPLSREERDAKKKKIDADEFTAHVNLLLPKKEEEIKKVEPIKKVKK